MAKDSMWQEILKSFWISGWTKQGLNGTQFPFARDNPCKQTTSLMMNIIYIYTHTYKHKANNIQWHTQLSFMKKKNTKFGKWIVRWLQHNNS